MLTRPISFRLDDAHRKTLREEAQARNMTFSALMREACEEAAQKFSRQRAGRPKSTEGPE